MAFLFVLPPNTCELSIRGALGAGAADSPLHPQLLRGRRRDGPLET